MNNTEVKPEVTSEAPKENLPIQKSPSKLKILGRRFVNFSKTKKGKIVIASSSVGIVVIVVVIGFLILKANPSSSVKVASNLASDKVYDNYDYIYNSGDNKLVASTVDNLKRLELISGSAKIMDYIISPDKKKIAYSVSDPDYKSKITSTNADLTKFNFDPVAFKVYQLNLETGENKLIWSTDTIQLGATSVQLYKKIQVVHPDSYVLSGGYINGIPASYPVSYITYKDDVAGGYIIQSLPYDLQSELAQKTIRLITYSPDSQSILLSDDKKVIKHDLVTEANKDLNTQDLSDGCYFDSGSWSYGYIKLHNVCYYGENYNSDDTYRSYSISNDELSPLFKKDVYGSNNYISISQDFALVNSGLTTGGDYGSDILSTDLSIYDFKTQTLKKVGVLGKNENTRDLEVIGSSDSYFLTVTPPNGSYDYSQDQNADWNYILYKYDPAQDKIEEVTNVDLPNDAVGFSYNLLKNTLSFYRQYRASTQTIIEYNLVTIDPRSVNSLLTIKVDNDSVLYYKPKLVWFDHK